MSSPPHLSKKKTPCQSSHPSPQFQKFDSTAALPHLSFPSYKSKQAHFKLTTLLTTTNSCKDHHDEVNKTDAHCGIGLPRGAAALTKADEAKYEKILNYHKPDLHRIKKVYISELEDMHTMVSLRGFEGAWDDGTHVVFPRRYVKGVMREKFRELARKARVKLWLARTWVEPEPKKGEWPQEGYDEEGGDHEDSGEEDDDDGTEDEGSAATGEGSGSVGAGKGP